jgi:hypothetical protein
VEGRLAVVHPAVDRGTVEALERLLSAARAGQIVGLAYVALHCGPDYSGDVVGRAKAHPLFTRGIVSALGDIVAASTQKNPVTP